VLHFAPEQAFYKLFRNQENLDYTTTDLLSPLADVKADICNLPFADNSYDIIFCNHVLEHIPDDTQAMKELFRVLKPGGVVVWVVNDQVKDGGETGSSFRQALYFQNVGFKIYDTMIYHKNGIL
jgi:ubiquinone/menaquinone biosynthesis C-methylase UbiE